MNSKYNPDKDYYKILGVDSTVDEQEVKQAFRKLSHTDHPDKGGDDKKYREILEAYETLSDFNSRTEYDQERTSYLLTQQKTKKWVKINFSQKSYEPMPPREFSFANMWIDSMKSKSPEFSDFIKLMAAGWLDNKHLNRG